MAAGGKDRGTRDARERSRIYQARQKFHDDQARRRRRDNLLAGIIGGALILAVARRSGRLLHDGPRRSGAGAFAVGESDLHAGADRVAQRSAVRHPDSDSDSLIGSRRPY